MQLLFLDDERNFEDVTWIKYEAVYYHIEIIRTYSDFVNVVDQLSYFDFKDIHFSFDYDINDYHKSGLDCLHYLLQYKIPELNEIFFHTKNIVGKKNMIETHAFHLDYKNGKFDERFLH